MFDKPITIDQSWLRCIKCGRINDLLDERKFRCPDCNDLFEIEHDFNAFPGKIAQTLKNVFRIRSGSFSVDNDPWEMSGIWRYKELIMPFLPPEFIVSLCEGIVPILPAGKNLLEWIGTDSIKLYLMLEGMTPTGSFKDFGGTVMISVAKAAGIKAVVCASTGDTSAMAAAYAAAAGMKCAVILPRGKVTAVQLAQPLVHGAKVITLPDDFDACMKVVQELVREYGAYPANSLNPARIEGHQATVFQVGQFFDWSMPDWIAVPVGNGSNCSSVGKAMRTLKKLGITDNMSHILGCQSSAANPLSNSWLLTLTGNFQLPPSLRTMGDGFLERWKEEYQPVKVGETTATAARIGDPVSRDKVMREIFLSNGAMITADEKSLNDAVAVCGKDGIFVCPQTGTALAGVKEAVRNGAIQAGQTVVVVSTATGLKFTESAATHLRDEIIDSKDCRTKTVAEIMELNRI